jgi:hypothetical protein
VSRRPAARRPAAQRRPRPAAPSPEPELDDFEDDDLDDYDDEDDEDDEPEFDTVDADAFFAAEVSTVQPVSLRLFGKDYTLPLTMPVAFSLLAERHREDESLATMRTVLAPVFGPDALDTWLAAGIDQRRLGVVLLWSAQNMHQPHSLSFEDAVREYDTREARGKALNRAQRRAGSGARR